MRDAIAPARTAVGFLTRIPVGRIDTDTLTRAAAYFPLVGGVVAAFGVGMWWVGTTVLGPFAGAVLGVLATVVVTGAIHEDGLADTVDGFWGGATPERRLAIMRDSQIGTYGAIAIGGDLLLRVALLVPYTASDWTEVARILIAGHVLGRAAPLVLAASLRPARADGQGVRLGPPTRGAAVVASATVVAAAIGTAGRWAGLVIVVAVLTVAAVRRTARRRIGGVTGDVLGAGVALTNLAVAATVAALADGDLRWDA